MVEYSPTEIKLAVTGYGRAEKTQLQQMVKLLLGLDTAPVAARRGRRAGRRHLSRARRPRADVTARRGRRAHLRSWRHARLPQTLRRQAP